MSYKLDSSNSKDPLASLFREKLENHQLPVDSDGWNGVRKQLRGGSRKLLFWAVFSAISAAVVALLFILSPAEESPVDHPLQGTTKTTNVITNDIDEVVIASNTNTPTATEGQRSKPYFVEDNSTAVNHHSKVLSTLVESELSANGDEKEAAQEAYSEDRTELIAKVENEIVRDNGLEITKPEESNAGTKIEADKESVSQQVYRTDLFELGEEPRAKGKKNWTLAAAYTGHTISNSSTSEVQTSSIVRSSLSENVLSQTAVQDYGEGKHTPELSLSFIIGKRIGKRLSIESGLAYTFLHSEFDGTKYVTNFKRTQNLHYIGIPVNITGYILSGTSRWNLYASAGGMVEKGIRMTYKVTTAKGIEGERTESGGESISGVQFSANASIGVSYDISRKFSLFLAPRLSYYFDNDQPQSIRTDRNVSIGATIGLKYNL